MKASCRRPLKGPTTGHWIYEKGAGDYALTSGTAFFWPHQRNRTSTAVAVPGAVYQRELVVLSRGDRPSDEGL
jgi:hypothetical protein